MNFFLLFIIERLGYSFKCPSIVLPTGRFDFKEVSNAGRPWLWGRSGPLEGIISCSNNNIVINDYKIKQRPIWATRCLSSMREYRNIEEIKRSVEATCISDSDYEMAYSKIFTNGLDLRIFSREADHLARLHTDAVDLREITYKADKFVMIERTEWERLRQQIMHDVEAYTNERIGVRMYETIESLLIRSGAGIAVFLEFEAVKRSNVNQIWIEYNDGDIVFRCQEISDSTCPICLNHYVPETAILITKCHHGFHAECLREWMTRSPTCPVCRKDVGGASS